MLRPSYIQANWPAPNNVRAFTSCRSGGFSRPPFDSFNLAQHVGDDQHLVNKNRQLLPNYKNFTWLNQTHSNHCVDLGECGTDGDLALEADACFATSKKQVCAVMTADCLPILFCDQQGSCVAAVHAGWRGLADGVIENTVSKMPVNAKTLMAWMGPAISQQHFEVGEEIKEIFSDYPQAFRQNQQTSEQKYFADLYHIAKQKMLALGITHIFGGEYCTYKQEDLFFSHRRITHQAANREMPTATTGRIVSAIYLS
ncbi:peptidoglycan editing factor PgeF [uncultured Paraglaciecola sp.]|uniref:peptidoglycan editing factor PgeF n=1 Tax=uncultured Paraglaciecola sp. TaxID=1765024 RepID=UPI0030D7901F